MDQYNRAANAATIGCVLLIAVLVMHVIWALTVGSRPAHVVGAGLVLLALGTSYLAENWRANGVENIATSAADWVVVVSTAASCILWAIYALAT